MRVGRAFLRITGLDCGFWSTACFVLGLAVFDIEGPAALAVCGRRFPTLLRCMVFPPLVDLCSDS